MAAVEEKPVGLYITSDTITIVASGIRNGRPSAHDCASAPTPAGAVVNGIINDPILVGQAIRGLLRDMNLDALSARVALSSDGYSIRTMRFPEVPAAERRALVKGELDQGAIAAEGREEFDFLWVSAAEEQGKKQADAYVYSSDAATVESVRESVRVAGLKLDFVEPSSIALIRSYVSMYPAPAALLCPSRKHTDLCIFDGEKIRSMRRIPTGVEDILSDRVAPQPEKRIRRSLDGELLELPAEMAALDYYEAVPEIAEPRASTTSNIVFLVSEINRSLAFFSREFPDAGRQQGIVVLGCDAVAYQVAGVIEGAMNLPLLQDSSLMDYGIAAQDDNSGPPLHRLIAIGAGLGGASMGVPALNLAHQSAAAIIRRQAPAVLLAGMGGSTIWMTGSIISAFALMYMITKVTQEGAEISREIAAIQEARAPILRKETIWNQAQTARIASQIPAGSALGRVAASTTPGVMLTSFKIGQDGRIVLEGRAESTESMQQFATALGKGSVIKAATFEEMRQDTNRGLSFKLVSVFRGTAKSTAKGGE